MIPALCDWHDQLLADLDSDGVVTPHDIPLIAQTYARNCPDCQEAA